MKNLKLVINNSNLILEKNNYFFNKKELKIILNLYAKMVSQGHWKDYSVIISKKKVSFCIYKRASENAVFQISKNFKPDNNNLKYYISDSQGNILRISKNLTKIINMNWDKYKNVN